MQNRAEDTEQGVELLFLLIIIIVIEYGQGITKAGERF